MLIKKTSKVSVNSLTCMKMNVILTFDKEDEYGDCQKIFNFDLPITNDDENVIELLDRGFFPAIAAMCRYLGHDRKNLTKISTASEWNIFEQVTGQPGLPAQRHSCNWNFGVGRSDLDAWEKRLMEEFDFGTNADMSWVDAARKQFMQSLIGKLLMNWPGKTT